MYRVHVGVKLHIKLNPSDSMLFNGICHQNLCCRAGMQDVRHGDGADVALVSFGLSESSIFSSST